MREPLVYLAGPIAARNYAGAVGWREDVTRALEPLGIRCLSPLRCKEFLSERGELPLGKCYPSPTPAAGAICSARGITTRDRWDVSRSDVVLMNLMHATEVSIGTMIEAGWADAFRRPLIVVMEPHGLHLHPILANCAGFMLSDLESAVEVVKAMVLDRAPQSNERGEA